MKKLTLCVTANLLAACHTTGTGTSLQTDSQTQEQIVVTATKRSEVHPLVGHMPSQPPAMQVCWDGSSLGTGTCPARPAFACPDGSVLSNANLCAIISTENVSSGRYIAEALEPEFETVTETIIVNPGETKAVGTPPQYETVNETIMTQEARTEFVTVPPVYHADGTVKTPASIQERTVPAVTRSVTRRVLKPGTGTTEISVPKDGEAVTHEIKKRVETSPRRWVIRDPEGTIIREFKSADEFAKFTNNPYKRVAEQPVSTFSADVDTASYSFVRQFVKDGRKPPKGSVRVEEMINYFDYDYDMPNSKKDPFKPNISVVPSPWNDQTKLVHIGLKGYDIPDRKRPDMNLVFLIDVSGSMDAQNKLPLLKRSFEYLVKNLGPYDKVSIVTYGPTVDTILEAVPGDRASEILAAIDPLRAKGGTAGAAGLQSAYAVAKDAFIKDGTNRIILATDGDFNIGISDPAELKTYVESRRDEGVYLSVLGFGQGNVKDNRMQAIAQNGNGTAGYIDSLREARKFFGNDMGKNFFPIANDLKIQVEFNPAKVSEYRLVGYETRAIAREDFNNDKVDAGDIGAGHTVTAIYEINPAGLRKQFVDPLRYGQEAGNSWSGGDAYAEEYGLVKLRYKRPGETMSRLMETPISVSAEVNRLSRASRDTRFATAVAAYGLKLRGDLFMDDMSWDDVTALAQNAKGVDAYGYRSEFVELTRDAASIDMSK